MSRPRGGRRLTLLRQVTEPALPETPLSDPDDDDGLPPTGPNFDLLPPPPLAGGRRRLDPHADVDAGSTQELSPLEAETETASAKLNRAHATRTPPPVAKRQRVQGADTKEGARASSALRLYQSGLVPEHTLRLQFIRRRPLSTARRRNPPIEDVFVLPRPPLRVLDLLPPPRSLDDLLRLRDDGDDGDVAFSPPAATMMAASAIQAARVGLAEAWPALLHAPPAARSAWRSHLAVSDWVDVFIARNRSLPAVEDLVICLGNAPKTDPLARFTWEELFVPICLAAVGRTDNDSSLPTPRVLATLRQLLPSLLSHEAFRRRIPARDFRAQLRAKNLRACFPEPMAAEIELLVLKLFHEHRKEALGTVAANQ